MRVLLAEMTWKEVVNMLPTVGAAIIPAGSLEQHGPHLSLQHDTASALYVSRAAAERLYPRVIVTPPINIGFSPFHMGFPGSLTLRHETLIELSLDIHASLKRHGIQKVVTVNGHGGNEKPLHIAARAARDRLNLTTAFLSHWDLLTPDVAILVEDKRLPGHAADYETSMALAAFPEGTRPEEIDRKYLERLEEQFAPYQRFLLRNFTEYSKTGVHTGDPTLATREKGLKFIETVVDGLAAFLEAFMEYGDDIPSSV